MADSYKFQADASVTPTSTGGSSSGISVLDVPLDEELVLTLKSTQVIELISDAAATVQLPGPSSSVPGAPQANVLVVKVIGPRVKVAITTPDGAAQVLPADPLLVLHTTSVSPITALTLTRTPGNDTFVHVFLGQM